MTYNVLSGTLSLYTTTTTTFTTANLQLMFNFITLVLCIEAAVASYIGC